MRLQRSQSFFSFPSTGLDQSPPFDPFPSNTQVNHSVCTSLSFSWSRRSLEILRLVPYSHAPYVDPSSASTASLLLFLPTPRHHSLSLSMCTVYIHFFFIDIRVCGWVDSPPTTTRMDILLNKKNPPPSPLVNGAMRAVNLITVAGRSGLDWTVVCSNQIATHRQGPKENK